MLMPDCKDHSTRHFRARLLRPVAAVLGLWPAFLHPTSSFAHVRPSIDTMSCSAAAGLVASHGAIVLGTGPNTYGRFVRNGSLCEFARPPGPLTSGRPTPSNASSDTAAGAATGAKPVRHRDSWGD